LIEEVEVVDISSRKVVEVVDEDLVMQFAKDWNFGQKSVKVPLPQTQLVVQEEGVA